MLFILEDCSLTYFDLVYFLLCAKILQCHVVCSFKRNTPIRLLFKIMSAAYHR